MTLVWKPGLNVADGHDVYFGTSQTDVTSATTATTGIFKVNQDANTYSPGLLQKNTTYYWRIDEVDTAHPDSPWKGTTWSFTI